MRMSAAVLAAVLSVATGGPLRCPCQLAQLVWGSYCVADDSDCERAECPCHSHEEPGQRDPGEPCHHGLGLEVVAVVNASGGDNSFDGPMPAPVSRAPQLIERNAVGFERFDCLDFRSISDRLLYCHSFRC